MSKQQFFKKLSIYNREERSVHLTWDDVISGIGAILIVLVVYGLIQIL